ncbi:MAG: ATP synthase F1 subunit delta [Flavobacteriia bacterium]|nr:ATP synthase F1 subunit delta [Flavobacteriia bacterium]
MASTKSAVRYAKALLDLCSEKGLVDAIEKDLQQFINAVQVSNDLRVFLNSPIVRGEKKNTVFQALFANFNPLTLHFFNLVIKNGKEAILPEIANQFNSLLKKQRGIVTGTITSAAPLSASTKETILKRISPAFEGTLSLSESVDPTLLGGFVIRVEDKQIDASAASKLKELKQELVK